MKTNLFLILSFLFSNVLPAQITSPAIKANFGVDADLGANIFNSNYIGSSDDWFKNSKFGTGQFMIDTTGAASTVANYFSNPASRMASFSRLMKPAFYSTVQNKLVIDAIFHRDFHGNDSTVFALGSNKNGMSPATWSCPVTQNIPDKNDILDAFAHVRRDGANVTDSLWMFGGISIQNTNGNRYFDFELYQTNIVYNRASRTFSGYGANAGHTAWQFDAGGNVIKAGDIIFSAEYSSSSLTLIQARIWINRNSLSVTLVNFTWGGQFDGDGNAATYGYASIIPKTSGSFYTGLQSAAGNVWAGPFALVQQDNSVVTNYVGGQFMEFSVNLSKLGVDPGSYSNNPCGTPFRRVLIKTRSSTSFTSELKDFIAPFSMFDYPAVRAFTEIPFYCREFPLSPIVVLNPNPTSVYTWSTTDGHIVGGNTGTTIFVDSPGTYKVTQQLNAACPAYSVDSVTMYFSKTCLLNVDLNNFRVSRLNNTAELKWEASNNKEAANFKIEYSLDGRSFLQLGDVKVNNETNFARYTFNYPFAKTSAAVIYYRINVIGKDGSSKYSNIIILRNQNTGKTEATIFPNPTRGELWFSVKAVVKETAEVSIWDTQGKLITSTMVKISLGENLLRLPDVAQHTTGVYFVKVKLADGVVTHKILKL
jgi:Secretion system C-terminal sorting domain